MQLKVPTGITDPLMDNLKTQFLNLQITVKFFTGDIPNLSEIIAINSASRAADLLGTVDIEIVEGEFDDTAPFTPILDGKCTWFTITPQDDAEAIIVYKKPETEILLDTYDFTTDVENNITAFYDIIK
jgi:hypothetical protein